MSPGSYRMGVVVHRLLSVQSFSFEESKHSEEYHSDPSVIHTKILFLLLSQKRAGLRAGIFHFQTHRTK